MINIFKAGGDYKKPDGTLYSVKSIGSDDRDLYLKQGWKLSLDDIKRPKVKPTARKG